MPFKYSVFQIYSSKASRTGMTNRQIYNYSWRFQHLSLSQELIELRVNQKRYERPNFFFLRPNTLNKLDLIGRIQQKPHFSQVHVKHQHRLLSGGKQNLNKL